MIALCSVLSEFEGTSLEFIPSLGPFEPWAMELMSDMSVAANSPLNWNVLNINARPSKMERPNWKQVMLRQLMEGEGSRTDGSNDLGPSPKLLGGFVLDALPEWENFILLSKEDKLAALRDPDTRKALDDNAQQDGPLRNVAHWGAKTIFHTKARKMLDTLGCTYEISEITGESPWNTLVDIAIADDLETSFGNLVNDEPDADWEARVEVWRDSSCNRSFRHAGAHLDLFLSSNYSTYMLGEAVRKRSLLPLEEAIHLLTEVPANFMDFETGEH